MSTLSITNRFLYIFFLYSNWVEGFSNTLELQIYALFHLLRFESNILRILIDGVVELAENHSTTIFIYLFLLVGMF
jgi:hypothetical protein